MKRLPIGKALRFQVFRRDGFLCLYCGRRPPEVVLQVDHILPLARGGDTEPTNLVTCCSDCNQGKRDEIVVSPFEWEDSELRRLETLQRLAEMRAYRALKAELDGEIASAVEDLLTYWRNAIDPTWSPPAEDLKHLLDAHDPGEIEKAFYLASRQSKGVAQDRWRYACAVLRNWRSRGRAAADGGKERTG